MTSTTHKTKGYAVWSRDARGIVSPTFPTREAARAWLGESTPRRHQIRKVGLSSETVKSSRSNCPSPMATSEATS